MVLGVAQDFRLVRLRARIPYAGAGKREPWEVDSSPTAPSQVTHVAQCVVFGAVMADAAMLDAVLELDVWGRERGADGRPRHGG